MSHHFDTGVKLKQRPTICLKIANSASRATVTRECYHQEETEAHSFYRTLEKMFVLQNCRTHVEAANEDPTLAIGCSKCKNGWHTHFVARKGIKGPDGSHQWECPHCSKKRKATPFIKTPLPQPTDTGAEPFSNEYVGEIICYTQETPKNADTQAVYALVCHDGATSTLPIAEVVPGRQAQEAENQSHLNVLGLSTEIGTDELDPDVDMARSKVEASTCLVSQMIIAVSCTSIRKRSLKHQVLTEKP